MNNKRNKLPDPPRPRLIKEGCPDVCSKCGSSLYRVGFLGLFGRKVCCNIMCGIKWPRS